MAFPLASIPAIIQGVTAASQLLGGAGIEDKRPEYEIPDSVKQALALSKAKTTTPYMPGYSESKTNIDLATANKIKAAAGHGNVQESLAGISGQESANMRNLDARNEAFRERSMDQYSDALNAYGEFEDKEFQINELDPYKDAFSEKRDIIGAGLENIFGAADKIAMLKKYSNSI